MNVLNLGNRQAAQSTSTSRSAVASPNISKSLKTSSSATFGKTLTELQTAHAAKASVPASPPVRQNFVAALSNSRATLPRTTSAAPASTATPATPVNDAPESASTGLFEQIIASEQATNRNPAAQTSGQQVPSTVLPAAPPTPYVTTQTMSTDPSVFTTANYSEQLNYSMQAQQVNDENGRRYANYMNEYQNWQLNGSQGQPPQAPVYESIDMSQFNQWWTETTQNLAMGVSAPDPSMFLINGPNYGNGYYGMVGSSQVGTLYNPTGPATAEQIQSASNPGTHNSAPMSVRS